jgi:hypothetical protein
MENFKITKEEKERILNLHEGFVIKEQDTNMDGIPDNFQNVLQQLTQQPKTQTTQQPQTTQQQPQTTQQQQVVQGEKIIPGVYNATVKLLQDALNEKYQAGLVPDGKLGPKTMMALEKAMKQKGINLGQPQQQVQQPKYTPTDDIAADGGEV